MKITALIMAGGRGERFWPRSRKSLPKQFLSLEGDGKTMIQHTVERVLPLIKIEDIFVVTSDEYKGLVAGQLPELPEENILCEPVSRNTAPCIGMGAVYIAHKYKDALMVVLPSDHLIRYSNKFIDTIKKACEVAIDKEGLVTIGITPSYPETGYGYIGIVPSAGGEGVFAVEQFVEKPCLEMAEEYLRTGKYLWNSGMFVWKASSILKNMEQFMPETFQGLMRIQLAIGKEDERAVTDKEFRGFAPESIDYGIMEKANDIYAIPGTFGWDDAGSWLAVERIGEKDGNGNTVNGNAVIVNSNNCIVEGGRKLIAAVGLEDIIIVDSDDAMLICGKRETGDIKKVLEYLRTHHGEAYL